MDLKKLAYFLLLGLTLQDIIKPVEFQPPLVFVSNSPVVPVNNPKNQVVTVVQAEGPLNAVVINTPQQDKIQKLPNYFEAPKVQDSGGVTTQSLGIDDTSASGKINNNFGSCSTSAFGKTEGQFIQLGSPSKIVKKYQDYLSQFKPKNSAFQKTINLQPTSETTKLRSFSYPQQTFAYRELVFNKNVDLINTHNLALDRKFNMDLNQFSDLSPRQFTNKYATLIIPSNLLPKVDSVNVPPTKTGSTPTQVSITVSQPVSTSISGPNGAILYPFASSSTSPTVIPSSFGKVTYTVTSTQTTSSIAIKQLPSISVVALPSKAIQTPQIATNQTQTGTHSSPPRNLAQVSGLPNENIDWRCKSISTVYAQGECGSCYAIASLDAFFISLNIKGPVLLPFSIQQILSCAKNDETLFGCRGGFFEDVYTYVRRYGIGSASSYPYSLEARSLGKNVTCNTTKMSSPSYTNFKRFVRGSFRISSGDCNQLVRVLKSQAVAVAIATGNNLQFYSNGTFTPQTISNKNINHGVTLVGYNPTNGFLIKNSWGNLWGMGGYGYVGKETGVCDFAIAPIL